MKKYISMKRCEGRDGIRKVGLLDRENIEARKRESAKARKIYFRSFAPSRYQHFHNKKTPGFIYTMALVVAEVL